MLKNDHVYFRGETIFYSEGNLFYGKTNLLTDVFPKLAPDPIAAPIEQI